jgi:phage tail-like protein
MGTSGRKSGTIQLRDESGNEVMSWLFVEAYPTKWIGPSFDSTKSAFATESLVLAHHGLFKA